MGGSVIIRNCRRYVWEEGAAKARQTLSSKRRLNKGVKKMRKTILTIFASALLAATAADFAAATEPHIVHKADRAPTTSEQIRNANAYAWPSPAAEPGWSRYEGGALSAPAGR